MAWTRARRAATVALAVVVAACGATPTTSSGSITTDGPSTAASARASLPATSAEPTTGTSRKFEPGSVVVAIVDGIRVRSRPEVSAESQLLQPLLPRGIQLFVLEAPVQASGYEWYRVVPISPAQAPEGWIASGSRDGVPWLETGSVTCPAAPTTVAAVAALSSGQALACFGGEPITVRGKLVHCQCEIDGR
jgi:hypothetical protein